MNNTYALKGTVFCGYQNAILKRFQWFRRREQAALGCSECTAEKSGRPRRKEGHLGDEGGQRSAMRMKSRIAATKEYLVAAAKMVAKMSRSCSSSEAPAQASAPVSTTIVALAGSGDSRSPHRISESAGRAGPFRSLSPSAGGPPSPPEAARATARRRARGRSEEEEEAGLRSLGRGCGRGGRRSGRGRVPACAAMGEERSGGAPGQRGKKRVALWRWWM